MMAGRKTSLGYTVVWSVEPLDITGRPITLFLEFNKTTLNLNGNSISFPEKTELENVRIWISDENRLGNEFKIGIEVRSEKRDVVLLKPKDPRFSYISFEYDGIHLDMILTKVDEIRIEDLVDIDEKLSTIFPDFGEAQKDLLEPIEKEIGSYILENHFQDGFNLKIENWACRDIYTVVLFELERPGGEDMENLKNSLEKKNSQLSESKDGIRFAIGRAQYYGFFTSESYNPVNNLNNPDADSAQYISIALLYHIFTLLVEEDEDTKFVERLESLNRMNLSLYGEELGRLTRLRSNLLILRRNLPTSKTFPYRVSLTTEAMTSHIDSLNRKAEILQVLYMNKKTIKLALWGILFTFFLSLISVLFSLFSWRNSKTPESMRMSIWRTVKYKWLLKIKYRK